jgi:hypothetical protein
MAQKGQNMYWLVNTRQNTTEPSYVDDTAYSVKYTVLQVSLGGHQWLFSVRMKADDVPALCLRHDVDGCLWQFESPEEDGHWPCTHIGTFLAFGYVQASKQQKKFCTCSPGTYKTSCILLDRFMPVMSHSKK